MESDKLIELLKNSNPMRYWNLSPSASQNQKNKLKSKILGSEYFATIKRDGVWYRSVISSSEILLQSRTISAKTKDYVEKQDRVPAIIEQLSNFPKNTVLIGEICFDDRTKTSDDIISIMGCLPKKAIKRQEITPVYYYIFDVLAYDGYEIYSKPAAKRIELVQRIAEQYKGYNLLEFAQPQYNNLDETIGGWLEKGEEGGVLMHKDKPYVFGDSPAWTTIKFKQSLLQDIDLVISGFTQPIKNYTGKYVVGWQYWENQKTGELVQGSYYSNGGYLPVSSTYFNGYIGGFIVGAYYNGNLINVGRVANLTDEIMIDATNHPEKYLGQTVEVGAMSIDTVKKSLRHPKLMKLRFDKDPKQCLYNKIFEG